MAPTGMDVKTFAGLDETAALFQEKLDRIRGDIGQAERALGAMQSQVDVRREEIATLDKAMESKHRALEQLTDKVVNGQAALEESKANIIRSMEHAEANANARLDAADRAEIKAHQATQAAVNQYAKVKAAKADVLAELETIAKQVQGMVGAVSTQLDSIT